MNKDQKIELTLIICLLTLGFLYAITGEVSKLNGHLAGLLIISIALSYSKGLVISFGDKIKSITKTRCLKAIDWAILGCSFTAIVMTVCYIVEIKIYFS